MLHVRRSNLWYRSGLILLGATVLYLQGMGQTRPTFTINGVPAVHGSTINICQGARLTFTHTTPFQFISNFNWRFDGGIPATSTSYTVNNVRFDNLGTGKAVITLANHNGQVDSSWVFLAVSNVYPKAGFSFSPTGLECGTSNFSFSDASAGGATFLWQFGDGRTSTQRNPVHRYDSAIGSSGNTNYTVRQIVTNTQGCSDTITQALTVKNVPDIRLVSNDPGVSFGPFNGTPTFRHCNNVPGYTFRFINQSSTLPANTAYTIRWGDGTPDTSFNTWPTATPILHTYPQGTRTMSIETTGSNGCTNTRSYNIFVGSNPAGGFASPGNTEVCAPDTLQFTISGTANNPPGTLYKVEVNDGSPKVTYNHPAPPTYTHLFQKSSCGIVSTNGPQTFSNSYYALLNIENPCGATSVNVIPIYVSGKPNPEILVQPSRFICVGTTTTIRNIGNYGGQISSTGGGGSTCENRGKVVWRFEGSTGFTITSGNVGSLNGSPTNGLAWTGGTESMQVNFSQPGIYKLWQYLTNDRCGVDSVAIEICVRTPPVPGFTMSKRTGCVGDTLRLNNTTPAGDCLGEVYNWNIRYIDPAGCGGQPSFNYIAGTGPSSENPEIIFSRAGRYIIEFQVAARASGCTVPLLRDTFTVAAKPTVQLSPITGICAGYFINPTATVNNCYATAGLQVSWTFSGGNPADATSLTPGQIVYENQGSYPVRLQVTNECGTTDTVRTLVVGSRPVADAGPDRQVCSGQTANIGSTSSAGVTYTWSPAAGLAAPNQSQTTFSRIFTGPAEDTTLLFVVQASLGANCQSTDTVEILVKKGPDLKVNPAQATLCAGGSVQLIASGADSYSWTPATGLNDPGLAAVIASPLVTTNYTLQGAMANGCSSSLTVPVTVRALPVVDAGPDKVVCNNAADIPLGGSPAGGQWSGAPFVSVTGVLNPRVAANGTYTLYYQLVANGCTGSDSLELTIQDPPQASAGTDTTVCADGTQLMLTGSPAGGAWSGSGLVTANGRFTASTPGNYTLIYSIGSGNCIGRDTMRVTVVAAVNNNTISSTQGVCAGATPAPLTGSNATAGGLVVTYQWQSSPDSLNWLNIAGATGRDLVIPSPVATIFYRRMAFSSVCAGGAASNGVRIFIHPDAKAQLNVPATTGCAPFFLNPAAMGLVPFPDRNGTYNWYANNSFLGTGVNFPGYTLSRPDDSVTIKLVTLSRFGCTSDSVSVQFKTVSNPVPDFSLSDTVGCGPLDILISNLTPSPGRYTYRWDFGNGQNSTQVQPGTIRFAVNPNRGDTIYTVTLRATGGCDTLLVSKKIRVRTRPRTLFTPDRSEGCSPMTVVFNNNSAGSNASFEWDFGDGSPRVPGTLASISHTFFTGRLDTFRVRLFGSNDCGTDTARFNLVVNPNRIRLDVAVNGDELNGCAPHPVRFINNTTGANLFRWTFNDGTPALTTNKGFDTLVHTFKDSGTYVVNVWASNGCSDTSTTETIRVVKRPVVGFTALPASICLGAPTLLTNLSEDGLTWNWDFGDGTGSTLRQPAKTFLAAGTYRIVLRGSRQFQQGFGCVDSAVATVVVSAPTGDWRYRGGNYCEGQSTGFEVTNSNATRFRYYFGNGDSLITTSPVTQYTYPQPGNYLPSVVLEYQGCRITLPGIDTVRMDRIRAGFTVQSRQLCGQTILSLTDTSKVFSGINRWTWQFGDGTVSVRQHEEKAYTRPGLYPITLQVSGNSGCLDSLRVPVQVAVQLPPDLTIAGPLETCIQTQANFVANDASALANAYNWTVESGGTYTGSSIGVKWVQPGTYNLQLIGRTAFGCADTARHTVRVNPAPVINAGPDVQICLGQSIQLNATSTHAVIWTPQQGLSCVQCANPVAQPNQTTRYISASTNSFGCTSTDTLLVQVSQPFKISVTPNDTICGSLNESSLLFASNAHRYQWNPSVGLSRDDVPNPVARPASTTTYRVVGFDADNCFTDTAWVTVAVGYNPTVQLPAGGLVVAGTQVNLVPALSGGPFRRYTWTPARDLSCTNCPAPVATINNNIRYRLEAETIYGCTASDTISFTVQCQPDQVYIPNAFSPDGDGINDILMVRGKGVARVKSLRIFNRFGQVVFERQNFDANDPAAGWNGKINGVPANADVYVFTAEVLCTAGATYTYKGNITLFR